jgi:DUF438 domain-containing protein
MSSVDIFKAHHAKIRSLISEISDFLTAEQALRNIDPLSKKIQLLFKIIMVHLNTEDALLYPEMLGSDNDKARRLAKKYQEEMGWIADSFKSFVDYWPLQENITSDPAKFCRETHKILRSLNERIDKEERYLYPQFALALPAN